MPDARIAQLQAMLAEREGKPGYKLNVIALKAELARLQGLRVVGGTDTAAPAADPVDLDKLTRDVEAEAGYPATA